MKRHILLNRYGLLYLVVVGWFIDLLFNNALIGSHEFLPLLSMPLMWKNSSAKPLNTKNINENNNKDWRTQLILNDMDLVNNLLLDDRKSLSRILPLWHEIKALINNHDLPTAQDKLLRFDAQYFTVVGKINLIALHVELGDPAQALQQKTALINYNSLRWEFAYNCALAHYDLGQFYDALRCLEAVSELEQKNVKIAVCYARVYQNLGFHQNAARFYKIVTEIAPDLTPPWFFLGLAQSKLGRLTEAFNSFDHAQNLQPENSSLCYNKGNVLLRLGHYSRAIECFKIVLRRNPGDVKAWNNLGIAYGRLMKMDEALHCYRRALSFSPRFADANLNCGLALDSMGEEEKALGYYRRFLQISSDGCVQTKSKIESRVKQLARNVNSRIIQRIRELEFSS